MRNILLISYYYNQTPSIAAVRLRGLAKYLPEFGWNPVVLTVKTYAKPDENVILFETPCEDICDVWREKIGIPEKITFKEYFNIINTTKKKTFIDRLLTLWFEIFTYPHSTIKWSTSAIEKGDEIIEKYHIDAIISSISPVTSHIIAGELVKRNNIPWIADFRDLWTQNHYYPYSKIRKFIEQKLECKTVSYANALTTVSPPFSEKLKKLHKNKKIYTITNGYDPAQINPGIPLTKKFSITLTGFIYKGRQDPEPLFRTLKNLIDEKLINPLLIEVNFFGIHESWLSKDIQKYHLQNIIQLHGQISRDDSIQKQRESQVLLLLTWNDPNEKGVYTGKIFDYLAARRPILALGHKGSVVADLINLTHAGVNVNSDAEIKSQILKFYREFEENGFVKYSGILSEIERFSHREMAKKFAEVLVEICESKNNLNT